MTLMERVRAAGNETEAAIRHESIAELRRRVQNQVPPDVFGRMRAENPARAENEIRAACTAIFDDAPWLIDAGQARDQAIETLLDDVFGLGPLEWMLADESITEIMVNAVDTLYVERDGLLESHSNPFNSNDEVRALIDRIIGPLGRRVDEASPMVNARLSQGHRVNAIIPPLAPDGPVLTIRKFRERIITLEEMVESVSIEASVRLYLVWCVHARRNLAVSGGTGSGKTTLLNALSCKIGQAERIITIEDSLELRFTDHPHVIRLEARPASIEGAGEVTIRDLVINALRMRPDRIIVGECRGGEALDMLQAMNTGHDGSLTTLHANSPADCILRLTTMVRYAADLPVEVVQAQIGSAIQCIVQTARDRSGVRFVTEIDEISYDGTNRCCHMTVVYQRASASVGGQWLTIPAWLLKASDLSEPAEGGEAEWMNLLFLPD